MIELGIFTFADLAGTVSPRERIRDIVEYGAYADQMGLDVFGVGEHHTPRFAVSSPAVVLAAVAAKTSAITLSTAVSVLSVLDPVRLHQDFAQLDLVSAGRAVITAGRSAEGAEKSIRAGQAARWFWSPTHGSWFFQLDDPVSAVPGRSYFRCCSPSWRSSHGDDADGLLHDRSHPRGLPPQHHHPCRPRTPATCPEAIRACLSRLR